MPKRKPHKLKTKKSIIKSRGFWLSALAGVVLITLISLGLFLDVFQIKNIIVSGNSNVSAEQITALVNQEMDKNISRSIFATSASSLTKKILSEFPKIQTAVVKKKLFSIITVVLTEREPALVFGAYYLDAQGIAFEESSGGFPVVRYYGTQDIQLGHAAISRELAGYILGIQEVLSLNSITLSEANISSQSRLDIQTSEGWKVYFNLEGEMQGQIKKLALLLEEGIEDKESLTYIDLRFKDRAYYK
ncbi:FtsQ-type POTRA domain-containing protein [Patescibacteria group bacterium]|nr:FtsQ-type POTRA domain-containing protein [Patescibacteria group bacterium]